MVTAKELQKKIAGFPRVKLVNLPTPLEKMPQLTKLLNGPRLWIKREDCTGLALGGNKERKAEFTMGDALSRKADTVITVGPIQSNHARATAAAARRLGLRAILVLTGEKPSSYDGNLLLNRLLGAEIRFLKTTSSKLAKAHFMEEIAEDLRRKGHVPYVIPTGASYPPGAIAYVNAVLELSKQAQSRNFTIDQIVHAAGSGGTQAGLILGSKALGSKVSVLGICVEPGIKDELVEETIGIAKEAAKLLDLEVALKLDDVALNEDYVGEKYELPTPEALKAIKLVAQTEAIFLDPIYTGRAMAGLISLIKQGHYERDDNVVFMHTGGIPTLFPYKGDFA